MQKKYALRPGGSPDEAASKQLQFAPAAANTPEFLNVFVFVLQKCKSVEAMCIISIHFNDS